MVKSDALENAQSSERKVSNGKEKMKTKISISLGL